MTSGAKQTGVSELTARPVSAGSSATRRPSVKVQSAACKPPFFCITGVLCDAPADVRCLARFLRPDQPLYRLGNGQHSYARVEAWAAGHVDEVRTIQPRGPYILGGICSGGVVAFEVAQQLQAQGQQVALLAMVNPPPPPAPGLHSYLNQAAAIVGRIVQSLYHPLPGISQRSPGGHGEYLDPGAEANADPRTVARYAPRPYPGRIDLFLTRESLASPSNPQLNWRELAAGGIEVHVFPRGHDGTIGEDAAWIGEAGLHALTEQLETCIDQALANGYRF